jgi:REP element-mobilizing transposase RayT
MAYNPKIHHRSSIRLKGYDYSQAGAYFITICCEDRICRFGKVINGEMILNQFGFIAYNEWIKLAERFFNFELDVFQIMPNHVHMILVLKVVGATLAVAQENATLVVAQENATLSVAQKEKNINNFIEDKIVDENQRAGASPAPTAVPTTPSISDIIGAYKSIVANKCLEIYKQKNEQMGKIWQRNYYEHIIRNEQAYHNIANYIINNPQKWDEDKFYIYV